MTNKKVISELIKSKIIVDEKQLIISNEIEKSIPLTDIKQLSTDGDIKYIRWFLLLLIPTSIILYSFGSELPVFFKWLLLVIGGVLGLKIIFGPPEREYLVINMKKGEDLRIAIDDKLEDEIEFIRKTNVYLFSLNKKN